MAHIKVPFNVPHIVQVAIAVLSALAVIGVQVVGDVKDVLPAPWTAGLTSFFAVVAAVAGFLKKAEPIIDDLL